LANYRACFKYNDNGIHQSFPIKNRSTINKRDNCSKNTTVNVDYRSLVSQTKTPFYHITLQQNPANFRNTLSKATGRR